jgi:transcription-repair coupling factor (superfamily II helicase)
VQLHQDKYANPAGLVQFIHAQGGAAKVRDNKVVVRREWPTDKARLAGAFGIARDLAALVKPEPARAPSA